MWGWGSTLAPFPPDAQCGHLWISNPHWIAIGCARTSSVRRWGNGFAVVWQIGVRKKDQLISWQNKKKMTEKRLKKGETSQTQQQQHMFKQFFEKFSPFCVELTKIGLLLRFVIVQMYAIQKLMRCPQLHYFVCIEVIHFQHSLSIDHRRSDWLGCWAEFVQMARFKLLFCLYLTFQNNLTYLGWVCTRW